ncbi:MAG: aldehyde dehydrogenase family protein, partial [Mesonia sp.]
MQDIKNFIGGQLQKSLDNQWLDNYNPAKGEVYSKIPASNAKDVEQALEAAKEAFPIWSKYTIEQRSKALHEIADKIEENLIAFAEAESLDNGKPLSLALTVDIPRAISNFRFYAQAITQFASKSHETVGTNSINFTLKKPVGVV